MATPLDQHPVLAQEEASSPSARCRCLQMGAGLPLGESCYYTVVVHQQAANAQHFLRYVTLVKDANRAVRAELPVWCA